MKEFIDERGFSSVFLIGWSMGGSVVMSYCEQFGSHGLRVIGIVDSSPRLLPSKDWLPGVDTTFTREAVEDWRRRWKSGDRQSVISES